MYDKKTAVIAPYDIHRLHFLMAGRFVLCEVQMIPYISINFNLQNLKKKINQIVFEFSFS
jgi:hypothetical protein